MEYTTRYASPLGMITLASDGSAITGLWFDGQKYYARTLAARHYTQEVPVLTQAQKWLDIYFTGREPEFMPPVCLRGSPFQMAVWAILRSIPYGTTTTYGAIAARIAAQRGVARMSAQAVGGAVGHNPVGIIVPCHRVVGTHGNLTGYAGGMDKKVALLTLEQLDMSQFTLPEKGTAL